MSTSETAVTDVVLEKKKSSKRDKSREPRELAKVRRRSSWNRELNHP